MGRWQATDIAALLKTGIAAHSTATGPMAEVVRGSTQYLSDDDALAIGVYLKTLPRHAGGHAAPGRVGLARLDGYRRQDLPPAVRAMPSGGGRGRRFGLARAGRQSWRDRAVARQCHPHGARRRLRAGHGGQSPASRHAAVRATAERQRHRRAGDLYPQQLGQRGGRRHAAGGQARATRPRAIEVGAPGVRGRRPVPRLKGRASGRGLLAWAGPAPRGPVRPACARPRPGLRSRGGRSSGAARWRTDRWPRKSGRARR